MSMQGFTATMAAAWGAALALGICAPAMAQEGDVARGKAVFMRCIACHATTPGAPGKLGPNLSGVMGRPAGHMPGYRYSPAMAQARFNWAPDKLDQWLRRPATMVPGTTMAFAGLPDPAERKAVIAYLAQLRR